MRAPGPLARTERRQEQRGAEQEKGRPGHRRRSAREHERGSKTARGNNSVSTRRSTPSRYSLRIAAAIRVAAAAVARWRPYPPSQGEQAPARDDEQHRDQRLGGEDELGEGKQSAD